MRDTVCDSIAELSS